MLTGKHGGHAAVRANAGTVALAAEDASLAQILKNAGYRTGGFGKWGLGDAGSSGAPTNKGFDEFFGYLHQTHAHTYYPEFLWDNQRRVDLAKGAYSADLIARRSFDFIDRHRNQPFFLYATYTLPHGNFEGPDTKPYTDAPWPEPSKHLAAMITRADGYVGEILRRLREYRLDSDTLVILSSDNGAPSGPGNSLELFRRNGALRANKGTVYEGGIRVPAIVRWPGRVKSNAVSSTPWGFVDFVPTLADVAGAKAPAGLDGVSMAAHLKGGSAPKREYLYWEQNQFNIPKQQFNPEGFSAAVRVDNWKLVQPPKGAPLELYDLAGDPAESKNLAAANPAVTRRLAGILKSARTEPRPHKGGRREHNESWSE